jgi:hypothetical protein
MDILKLGKKTVLIPTPGQAEQEYLASRLHQQKRAFMATQKGFSLGTVMEAISSRSMETIDVMDDYKEVVDDFCQSLSAGNV